MELEGKQLDFSMLICSKLKLNFEKTMIFNITYILISLIYITLFDSSIVTYETKRELRTMYL